ncbi:hypothetical protein D0862_13192 [Hortaea werneckii]|uniref:Zn(2)-C6 fungal-type domain-containing protein n=1 Tax=Hortaea werneckii TaxID=91943 RepID=A0A3M7ESB8_HORWE|nr:hypothetical protein D0862_13192 [Hortaea werneckii]
MSMQAARLSCEQCQARKTKCDKNLPCSACVKAGHQCTPVQRQRLPRGRSGKARSREDALKARIGRLESVVTQLQSVVPGGTAAALVPGEDTPALTPISKDRSEDTSVSDVPIKSEDANAAGNSKSLRGLVAPTFWNELSEAVSGLRDALEETKQEDDSTPESLNDQFSKSASGDSRRPSGANAVLFPRMSAGDSGNTLNWLEPGVKTKLVKCYRERYYPIVKGGHWPSIAATIRFGWEIDPNIPLPASARALEAAICFAGACVLSETELDHKHDVVAQTRLSTETFLSEAGLLSTRDFVVLQAFAFYVATLRLCQCNADQWTLIACVVRIASAQGLSAKSDADESILDWECRLQLWFMIGLLDLQAAFDRGTKPLLGADDFTVWPSNVNDEELITTPQEAINTTYPTRFTDMTFPLMTYRAMMNQHVFTNIGYTQPGKAETLTDTEVWQEKAKVFRNFEEHVEGLKYALADSPNPFARYVVLSGEYISANMRTILRRPIYPPIRGRPPASDDVDVLQHATVVLESALGRSNFSEYAHCQEFSLWSWNTWIPWYAIAVVLAELCRSPQSPIAERSWRAAEESYAAYAQRVADGQSGLLWRPVERLMQKARALWRRPAPGAESGVDTQKWVSDTSALPSYSPIQRGSDAAAPYMDMSSIPSTLPPSDGDEAMSWFDWEYFLEGLDDDGMMRL